MKGVIYCRVSSKEQVEGTSLESQELACREYAQAHNIQVIKVFVERGESAKFSDRTELMALMDFCREHKGGIEVLLVWKIDRFARNVGDHFTIKAALLKYGVRVVSVTEPIDSNPEGKLLETILAGFAQFDNDIRAMRTVHGMRRRLQEGIFPWKPPLGYKSPNLNGEKKTEPDVPDQPVFDLVRRAWHELATGAYTRAEIKRLMTAWGVAPRKGGPLSSQSVDWLFHNPYYAGVLVDPWSGEEHGGKHVPMVSREVFARVQEVTKRRCRSFPHQRVRPEFPLRGLVRCSNCGRYLTGSFSRGRSRRYPYYHCPNPKCGQRKSYPAGEFHKEFESFLCRIAPKQELVAKLGDLIIRAAEERQSSQRARKERKEAEVARLNSTIRELITMRAQKLVTDSEFLRQKSALTERRFALEAAEDVGDIKVGQVRQQIGVIAKPLAELGVTWNTLPAPFRWRFERLLLPVGFVNGKSRTAELGLLFRVFDDLQGTNTNGVARIRKYWNQILCEIQKFSAIFRRETDAEKDSE